MDAVTHGTYCLCVGSDTDPLGGWGQLCCLLQDFREGQEIVEEQEPFTLCRDYVSQCQILLGQ